MCNVSPFCDLTLQSLTRFLTPIFNLSSAANDTKQCAKIISVTLRNATLYIFEKLDYFNDFIECFVYNCVK